MPHPCPTPAATASPPRLEAAHLICTLLGLPPLPLLPLAGCQQGPSGPQPRPGPGPAAAATADGVASTSLRCIGQHLEAVFGPLEQSEVDASSSSKQVRAGRGVAWLGWAWLGLAWLGCDLGWAGLGVSVNVCLIMCACDYS